MWVAGVNLTGPTEERAANLLRIDPISNTIGAALPVDAFSASAGADAVWVTSPGDGVNDSLHKPEAWVAQEIDPDLWGSKPGFTMCSGVLSTNCPPDYMPVVQVRRRCPSEHRPALWLLTLVK